MASARYTSMSFGRTYAGDRGGTETFRRPHEKASKTNRNRPTRSWWREDLKAPRAIGTRPALSPRPPRQASGLKKDARHLRIHLGRSTRRVEIDEGVFLRCAQVHEGCVGGLCANRNEGLAQSFNAAKRRALEAGLSAKRGGRRLVRVRDTG